MDLKFDTSVTKGLKVKVRNFGGLIPAFVEVTEENLIRGLFTLILNRANIINPKQRLCIL